MKTILDNSCVSCRKSQLQCAVTTVFGCSIISTREKGEDVGGITWLSLLVLLYNHIFMQSLDNSFSETVACLDCTYVHLC